MSTARASVWLGSKWNSDTISDATCSAKSSAGSNINAICFISPRTGI